jgi:hypothetical protein
MIAGTAPEPAPAAESIGAASPEAESIGATSPEAETTAGGSASPSAEPDAPLADSSAATARTRPPRRPRRPRQPKGRRPEGAAPTPDQLAKAAAQTIKESLCCQAEQGAIIWTQSRGAVEWRRLRREWKRAGPTHRRQEGRLLERLEAAHQVFLGRIDLERSRRLDEAATAKQLKLDLCRQAEAVAQLDDIHQATKIAADLMAQWKQVKRTDPRIDNELWERFKIAQDQIFARRQAAGQARQAAAAVQRDLIAQARGLIGSADLKQARAQMRQIIDDFRAAGFNGRNLNDEFRQVRDEFFDWVKAEPDRRRQSGHTGTYHQRARHVTDIGHLEAEIARLEEELARTTPGPSQRRHGSGLRLSLGSADRHSQLSAELIRLRLRRDQLSRRLGDIDARLARAQSAPPPPSDDPPPTPPPDLAAVRLVEPAPAASDTPGPTEPDPATPDALGAALLNAPAALATTGLEPTDWAGLESAGLGADPQLQHGGETDLGVVQVEPADLGDPTQPVAQGVGVDEEAG